MDVYAHIRTLAEREELGHAFLITGPDAAEREKLGLFCAQALLCEGEGSRPCGRCLACRKVEKGIHPDLLRRVRLPDSQVFKVDQVREMSAEAYILPNEGKRKVFLLPEADTMNISAQNAFLKLLEEPPAFVSFLLCVKNPEALLETVRSRCGEERLPGAEEPVDPQLRKRAEGFLAVRRDRAELLRWSTSMEKLDGQQLLETVGCIRSLAVRETGDGAELLSLESFLARAEDYLRANLGVKLVTGYLSTYVYNEK